MDYKRIEKSNYNIHFINTNRFKTITVEINFTKELEEKNISYFKLLTRLISFSNKEYNTRRKMAIKLEELYNSFMFSSSAVIGSLENFNIGIEFLHPKYTEKDELDKNLDLLCSSLLKPNVKNNKFDEDIFNVIKDNIITNFKIREEYPTSMAYKRFEETMFKGTPAAYDQSGKLEIIEKLTPEDLYNFYKTIYDNHSINVLVYGDLDSDIENTITKYLDKNLKDFKSIPSNKLTPYFDKKFNDKESLVEEKKDITQSTLIMGYDVIDLDRKDDYALQLYNMIFGASSNSLLFMKVREEKSYCYSIRSSLYKYSKALVVTAGINKKNYKDSVKTIKDCVKKMNDRKTIEEGLKKVKMMMNTRLNGYYDSLSSISDHYYINEFDKEDDVEIQREKYNNVTVEDILEIGKHLKLDTIYYLEGAKENEEA